MPDQQDVLSVDSFVTKHLELLGLEREAEVDETRKILEDVSPRELQRRGICLLKLRAGSRSTELYGRTVLCFEPFWPGKDLPAHKLNSGDIVGVSQSQDASPVLKSGVITKTTTSAVHVAFDEGHEELGIEDDVQYQLTKLANDVSYRRIKSNLKDLRKCHNDRANHLIDVLFGEAKLSDPLPILNENDAQLAFFNNGLDDSQKEAVKFALQQKEVAIIHGPPGTGKTTTVVEIILQSVKLGLKVLACAPSNIAVDNLVERLSSYNTMMVRLGHPARFLTNIHQYSLDAILCASDDGKLMDDIRQDIDKTLTDLRKMHRRDGRAKIHNEARNLRKELRTREAKATKDVLGRASVVLTTITSAYQDGPLKRLNKEHFDLVVIDECSQGLEAACWIPLLLAPKCILAGDHLQLPPTIISTKAAKEGLEITLMERLIDLYGKDVVRMLNVQYRMHKDIMMWSSSHLYEDKLEAHSSVASHLLRDLPNVEDDDDTKTPLLLIDTAGCDLVELEMVEEASKGNEGEADLVTVHVSNLIRQGVHPRDIAVITPYNLQVDLLRVRLSSKYPALEIKSVDGFQGREKEAVVMSLVRSNAEGEVGFLADIRRMNVAVTRARRHLAVICDSETVCRHAVLKTLIEYLNSKGDVRSAHQYSADLNNLQEAPRPAHMNFQTPGSSSKKKTKASANASNKKAAEKKGQMGRDDISNCLKASVARPKTEAEITREQEMYNRILKQVQDFEQDSKATNCCFPCTLSSFERRIVHEIAENKNLLHSSQGEGDERYIVISKPAPKSEAKLSSAIAANQKNSIIKVSSAETSNALQPTERSKLTDRKAQSAFKVEGTETVDQLSSDESEQETDSATCDNENYKTCSLCQQIVPKTNMELHTLRCERNNKENREQAAKIGEKVLKLKRKKNKSKTTDRESAAVDEDEDFDAVVDAFAKENRTCHFQKCKTSTSCLGQTCDFCRQRFCFSHFIPEVHGCGEAARIHARQTVLREGVVHRGSGVPSKKVDQVKRAHLERKLDKKLTEMSSQRKAKKK